MGSDGTCLLTVSEDCYIRIWDLGKETNLLDWQIKLKYKAAVWCCAWNSNTQFAYGDNRGNINIWDYKHRKKISEFWKDGKPLTDDSGPVDKAVMCLAYSKCDQYLAAGDKSGAIKIYEMNTSAICTIISHLDGINSPTVSVAFSPDGIHMAAGSQDGDIRIWKFREGQEVAHLGHGERLNTVSYSPNGAVLASGSSCGTILIWGCRKLRAAKARITRRNTF